MIHATHLAVLALLVGCVAPPDADTSLPPLTGGPDMEQWLATTTYRDWECEDVASKGDGHGQNRVCSSALAVSAGTGEFPVDAAQVKEMWNDARTQIIGYSVSRHTRPGTTGDTWYWYERVALDSAIPHDADGVVADGWGGEGAALELCVGCHRGAGSDAAHSGHDFVYTVAR